jgi:hypothetical protein
MDYPPRPPLPVLELLPVLGKPPLDPPALLLGVVEGVVEGVLVVGKDLTGLSYEVLEDPSDPVNTFFRRLPKLLLLLLGTKFPVLGSLYP